MIPREDSEECWPSKQASKQASIARQRVEAWLSSLLFSTCLLDSSSLRSFAREGLATGNEAGWHPERCVHQSYHITPDEGLDPDTPSHTYLHTYISLDSQVRTVCQNLVVQIIQEEFLSCAIIAIHILPSSPALTPPRTRKPLSSETTETTVLTCHPSSQMEPQKIKTHTHYKPVFRYASVLPVNPRKHKQRIQTKIVKKCFPSQNAD